MNDPTFAAESVHRFGIAAFEALKSPYQRRSPATRPTPDRETVQAVRTAQAHLVTDGHNDAARALDAVLALIEAAHPEWNNA